MKIQNLFKVRNFILITVGSANMFLFQNCSNYSGQVSLAKERTLQANKDLSLIADSSPAMIEIGTEIASEPSSGSLASSPVTIYIGSLVLEQEATNSSTTSTPSMTSTEDSGSTESSSQTSTTEPTPPISTGPSDPITVTTITTGDGIETTLPVSGVTPSGPVENTVAPSTDTTMTESTNPSTNENADTTVGDKKPEMADNNTSSSDSSSSANTGDSSSNMPETPEDQGSQSSNPEVPVHQGSSNNVVTTSNTEPPVSSSNQDVGAPQTTTSQSSNNNELCNLYSTAGNKLLKIPVLTLGDDAQGADITHKSGHLLVVSSAQGTLELNSLTVGGKVIVCGDIHIKNFTAHGNSTLIYAQADAAHVDGKLSTAQLSDDGLQADIDTAAGNLVKNCSVGEDSIIASSYTKKNNK